MDNYIIKAEQYLKALCNVKPNRRTGSPGNRQATVLFAATIRQYGYEISADSFNVLDYMCKEATLTQGEETFKVYASPYSLGCDVSAELITVSSIEELEKANCKGKILLLKGHICKEQLMPKNFIFYNPKHHKKIIALLENRKPAGIITATKRNPELVGAIYPFPLIVDGDFNIPSAYCRDAVGDILAALQDTSFRLKIDSRRIPSIAENIIARLNKGSAKKIIISAHIDAYEDTPGASDNASGIVVLLLLSEMLADYQGENEIEIVALNGEDHYSAGGQMDYLKRYKSKLSGVLVSINIDDIGYKQGRSAYSFYECPHQLEKKAEEVFRCFNGLCRGEKWFNGDHMIFVQNQVPSIAITSEFMPELMRTVTHTSADTPNIIDYSKLVEVAAALNALLRSL